MSKKIFNQVFLRKPAFVLGESLYALFLICLASFTFWQAYQSCHLKLTEKQQHVEALSLLNNYILDENQDLKHQERSCGWDYQIEHDQTFYQVSVKKKAVYQEVISLEAP